MINPPVRGLEPDLDEKPQPQGHGHARPGLEPRLDAASPVAYRYLTFETQLPAPPAALPDGSAPRDPVPACPNLSRYVSPMTWSPGRKAVLLALSCIATCLTAYSASAYSPPAKAIAADLGASHTVTLVGITTFCLGFALAPMAVAPMSEVFGRYPVFVSFGSIFVLFQIVCALVKTIAGMLVTRFLVGLGSSIFSAVVGGVISDVWDRRERNTPMALFSGAVIFGTGAGALVGGAIMEDVEDPTRAWKWVFWHQVIMDSVLVVLLIFFFKESRASVLLERKAKALNTWYEKLEEAGIYGVWVHESASTAEDTGPGSSNSTLPLPPEITEAGAGTSPTKLRLQRIRWVSNNETQRPALTTILATSVKRPFYLLFTEPVVFVFSLWAAFSWGVLYLSFAVVPYLYDGDFDMSSRVYAGMMGAAVAATIVGVCQERLLEHPQWRDRGDGAEYSPSKFWAFMRRRFPAEAPEARLYFACVTAMFLPAGLYGAFLSPSSMDGYSRAVGIGFANWGIYSVYLATFNYLADSYHIYASSALASQSFCRNIVGGAFPVITGTMFHNMGLKGAGGMLGGVATGLTVVPWVLVFFGARIRARSKFAISLQKE
jgi:MFS family permease